MPHWTTVLAATACATASLGCTTQPICTLSVDPGVVVTIRDAADGKPLASTARGVVRDGAFSDSLRPYGGLGDGTLVSRAAADERPGVYTVTVVHQGYAPWERSGVRVRPGECHVQAASLTADLQPVP
jgi:hypothetical protein